VRTPRYPLHLGHLTLVPESSLDRNRTVTPSGARPDALNPGARFSGGVSSGPAKDRRKPAFAARTAPNHRVLRLNEWRARRSRPHDRSPHARAPRGKRPVPLQNQSPKAHRKRPASAVLTSGGLPLPRVLFEELFSLVYIRVAATLARDLRPQAALTLLPDEIFSAVRGRLVVLHRKPRSRNTAGIRHSSRARRRRAPDL